MVEHAKPEGTPSETAINQEINSPPNPQQIDDEINGQISLAFRLDIKDGEARMAQEHEEFLLGAS